MEMGILSGGLAYESSAYAVTAAPRSSGSKESCRVTQDAGRCTVTLAAVTCPPSASGPVQYRSELSSTRIVSVVGAEAVWQDDVVAATLGKQQHAVRHCSASPHAQAWLAQG